MASLDDLPLELYLLILEHLDLKSFSSFLIATKASPRNLKSVHLQVLHKLLVRFCSEENRNQFFTELVQSEVTNLRAVQSFFRAIERALISIRSVGNDLRSPQRCFSLQSGLFDLDRKPWQYMIAEINRTPITEYTDRLKKSVYQAILFTHLHQGWGTQAMRIFQLYVDDEWATDSYIRYLVTLSGFQWLFEISIEAEWRLPTSFNMTEEQAVADKSVVMDYYRNKLLEDAYARLLRGEICFDYPLANLPEPAQHSNQGNDNLENKVLQLGVEDINNS